MIGFITGLPRSRTKWFAEYFDGIDGVDAYHEPLNGIKSRQEFYDLVKEGCVVSDSALFITDFQDAFPDVPTVIIERDIDEVFDSLCAYFDEQGYPKPSYEFLVHQKEAVDQLEGLRIPYNEIDSRLEEIHSHLGIPYNEEYAQRVASENLQIPILIADSESYLVWEGFREWLRVG